jgi:hypothetical protein
MRALACTLAVVAALLPARGYAQDARATTGAPAQVASPAKAKPNAGKSDEDTKAEAADAAARARVFEVLRAVADEAPRWKDDAAAASVQAQIADLTWARDADSARAVLARVGVRAPRAEVAGRALALQELAAGHRGAARGDRRRTPPRARAGRALARADGG